MFWRAWCSASLPKAWSRLPRRRRRCGFTARPRRNSVRGSSPKTSSTRFLRSLRAWRIAPSRQMAVYRKRVFGIDVRAALASRSAPSTAARVAMPDPAPAGFFEGVFDRTLTNLRSAWREIAESARGALTGTPRPDLPGEDASRLHQQMLRSLNGSAGGVTARARAADLGRTYLALDAAGRERFLQLLAREFDVDHDEIRQRCRTLLETAEPAQRASEERALRAALEPPRITLLRQFNALPEGVKFLVDRRAELIGLGRQDPLLGGLEDDLKRLLANWFDIGFLELKRIS